MEVIPRLSYYMQRVLVRLAREAQRLAGKVVIIIIVIIIVFIIIIIDDNDKYEAYPLPTI